MSDDKSDEELLDDLMKHLIHRIEELEKKFEDNNTYNLALEADANTNRNEKEIAELKASSVSHTENIEAWADGQRIGAKQLTELKELTSNIDGPIKSDELLSHILNMKRFNTQVLLRQNNLEEVLRKLMKAIKDIHPNLWVRLNKLLAKLDSQGNTGKTDALDSLLHGLYPMVKDFTDYRLVKREDLQWLIRSFPSIDHMVYADGSSEEKAISRRTKLDRIKEAYGIE